MEHPTKPGRSTRPVATSRRRPGYPLHRRPSTMITLDLSWPPNLFLLQQPLGSPQQWNLSGDSDRSESNKPGNRLPISRVSSVTMEHHHAIASESPPDHR